MRITLLALAAVAILAQQALAEPSVPIPGCLETFKIPSYTEGGCMLLAQEKGITFQNLLDWNTCLRRDCLNLDVENDICVKGPLKMGPAITCKHATNSNKPTTQAATTNADSKPQSKATRPLYPNMVPPKAAQQQQPPKPMAEGPNAESVSSPVPGGASLAPNPPSVLG
ncbi:hypothetical protein BG006_003086 [Podila minutissima]|uniref:LysM domain-containing protein n=1 Tax=Podila minutissima TaxID=64525 RepID=A0A9P5SX62_9FUNG|nr:hypothetical protein BG006_003086 [Podila minutissima]